MANTGRFGKYGDLKRKEKIRQNLTLQGGASARAPKHDTLKTQQLYEKHQRNKPK